ncbi:DDE-type integrase/transposase/recombinase [Archaeoglobus veneficus]|uniref:Transposase IS204/IS1001/IS1096/IS1165 family protein n=1 Tax=Archaeoglobus veneficus (strain DSM 11195 / SNP6) TaxID=693661 RepID=F2KQX4_ARCVS|nr:DDE-type integrase/transposase/recombinase [Archaeoglobus veneficus]AEA47780.1 transposase IS204/IS1001/IS1096/IS1165 family protein [Archaeoglobus veneficus SNP6]
MVIANIADNDLIKILESFKIFERNKVSLEIKLIAIAMYIVSSSVRRIALLFNVGKSTVHYWIEKFKDVLEFNEKEKVKELVIARIAVDETILKYNGKKCYLFAALDVERNKIVHLKVYPARNALAAYSFLREVLRMCEVEELILDKGPWYRDALQRLGVRFRHEAFGERSLVESVFSSFKQRAEIFFCSITVNFRRREKKFGSLRWKRALECWNRFCRMFMFYFNVVRGCY